MLVSRLHDICYWGTNMLLVRVKLNSNSLNKVLDSNLIYDKKKMIEQKDPTKDS